MTQRRSLTLGLSPIELLVLLAYVAMLCIFVPRHEPWADEARAWMFARDTTLSDLLFRYLRYEGHPALWYLLLRLAISLHMPYAWFCFLSAAIASVGIYALLRLAPFPFYLRALLPFTFFLAYQYSVVARSYVLFPLMAFLAAHLFRSAWLGIRPRPIALAVVLGLLANVSVHGTLVALALAGLYWWRPRPAAAAEVPARHRRIAAALFLTSIVFAAVCIWPVTGTLPALSPRVIHMLDTVAVNETGRVIESTPEQNQSSSSEAETQAASPNAATPARTYSKLRNLPRVLSYSVCSSQTLAFLFEGCVLFWLWRRRQLSLALPLMLLTGFLVFVYSAAWHYGLLWVTGLMVLWIAWDESLSPRAYDMQTIVAGFLALLCLLQLPWTVNAFRYDWSNRTSPDKATAEYLRTLANPGRIAGFGMALGVQPYFPHNLYFNQELSFAYFDFLPGELTPRQTMQLAPDLVVTEPSQQKLVEASGYRLQKTFCGALFLPNGPLKPDCLLIYQHPPATSLP